MDEATSAKLEDIRNHPERHYHNFFGLQACCMVNGALSAMLMDAHPELGRNGGQKCDVTSGPCSCGAWH